MAININPGTPLRHVATFNSSTNWVAPAGCTLAFVALHGASGGAGGSAPTRYGNSVSSGKGGDARISGAFVQVTPGSAHVITIGAAGTGGAGRNTSGQSQAGGAGGSTNFDNAFIQTGGAGGNGANASRYSASAGSAGADASAGTGTTSLTSLSPAGALVRTATISSQATGASGGGAATFGCTERYGTNSPSGAAGSAGQINIYI